MKAKCIGYWITTVLVAGLFAMGGVMDIMGPESAVKGMAHLGYPAYMMIILGVWKLLAVPALLAPRFPLLKEWTYAGIIFDVTGASASSFFVGDPVGTVIFPLLFALVVVASWALRPESRKLPGVGCCCFKKDAPSI